MPDWVKDDGTFEGNWHEHALPAEIKGNAALKDFKSVGGIAKAFLDTKTALGSRVEIPKEPAERRKFMAEQFKDEIAADEQARTDKAKKDAEEADKAAKEAAAKGAADAAEKARKLLKDRWAGGYDTNLELCRRAVRSNHISAEIKALIAKTAGAEPDKLTDEQIKAVIGDDPLMADWLLTVGKLIQDGHTEHGDGHSDGDKNEQAPELPSSPWLYAKYPEGHPLRNWFKNRGIAVEKK